MLAVAPGPYIGIRRTANQFARTPPLPARPATVPSRKIETDDFETELACHRRPAISIAITGVNRTRRRFTNIHVGTGFCSWNRAARKRNGVDPVGTLVSTLPLPLSNADLP